MGPQVDTKAKQKLETFCCESSAIDTRMLAFLPRKSKSCQFVGSEGEFRLSNQ